jgi:MFS transporter, PPP family, 3-phenylpropionic acid transporter
VTPRYLVLMLARGMINGSIVPFATVLLVTRGLPPALIGPLSAAAAVGTLLTAPAWGRLGDRHGRRRVLVLVFLVTAPVAAGHAAPWLPVLVVAFLGWSMAASAVIPLTDSLVLARLDGSRSRFSRVRIGASTGYILASVGIGAVISFTALGWAAPGLVGALLCLLTAGGVALRLGGELRSGTGVAVGSGTALLDGIRAGVRRHRAFLGGLTLVFGAANAPAIFTGPRLAEIGASGWEIGVAIAAGTLVELPAFLAMPWLLARIGGRRLFLVGGLLLGVSGLLAAVAPTAALVIAARLLFGAGYAWMVIPSLGAITSAAAPDEQAAAASMHFASSAAGSLVVALAGLPLVYASGSVAAVLAAAALAAPLGAVISGRAWPRRRPAPASG